MVLSAELQSGQLCREHFYSRAEKQDRTAGSDARRRPSELARSHLLPLHVLITKGYSGTKLALLYVLIACNPAFSACTSFMKYTNEPTSACSPPTNSTKIYVQKEALLVLLNANKRPYSSDSRVAAESFAQLRDDERQTSNPISAAGFP